MSEKEKRTRSKSSNVIPTTPSTPKEADGMLKRLENLINSKLNALDERFVAMHADIHGAIKDLTKDVDHLRREIADYKIRTNVMESKVDQVEEALRSIKDSMKHLDKAQLTEDIKEEIRVFLNRKYLVIFGLKKEQTTSEECTKEVVDDIIHEIQCDDIKYSISNDAASEKSPIKLSFNSVKDRQTVLVKAKELRKSSKFGNVYIKPELTFKQRKVEKECITKLKEKNAKHPGKYIIRNFQVVEKQQTSN